MRLDSIGENSKNRINEFIIYALILGFILLVKSLVDFMSSNDAEPIKAINAEWLNQSSVIQTPLHTDVFRPTKNKNSNRKVQYQRLSGKIKLSPIDGTQFFRLLKDLFNIADSKQLLQSVKQLPMMEFDFVQYQDQLLPSLGSVQTSTHPYWEWLVMPGKIWRESDSSKASRLVFPFALQEKNANCTHNGYITFSINNTGGTSKGYFQITSETCGYFQFDLAGRLTVDFQLDPDTDRGSLIADDKETSLQSKPVYSLTELAKDFPDLNSLNLIPPHSQGSTISGVVIGSKHYRLNCETRYGTHADCEQLALPSYSTAKSIYAGIALMRLEAEFPNIKNTLVTKIIPECKQQQWQQVTLSDLLNMRTGNYLSKKVNSDEDSNPMLDFFISETARDKIALACNMFPHQVNPGKVFVYHTSDTFLAGVMMERLYKNLTGKDDLYSNLLANDLWQKLGLSSLLQHSKRTYDEQQQTFTGWGLTYLVDDIVKIVKYLHQQNGLASEIKNLDPSMLSIALQTTKNQANRPTGAKNLVYNYGFWGLEVSHSLGCRKEKWIPFMSGYGGITIAMISPDVLYYNFSDDYQFLWLDAVIELNKQFPICEAI